MIVSGRVISCMSHLPQKALLPMAVMPSGIFEVLQPTTSLLVAVSMIALQSERESYTVLTESTLIFFKLEQLAKERPLMLVKLAGMTMELRAMHPQKDVHSGNNITLLKKRNSSNDVILVSTNASLMFLTAAASPMLSSPSPFVSQ